MNAGGFSFAKWPPARWSLSPLSLPFSRPYWMFARSLRRANTSTCSCWRMTPTLAGTELTELNWTARRRPFALYEPSSFHQWLHPSPPIELFFAPFFVLGTPCNPTLFSPISLFSYVMSIMISSSPSFRSLSFQFKCSQCQWPIPLLFLLSGKWLSTFLVPFLSLHIRGKYLSKVLSLNSTSKDAFSATTTKRNSWVGLWRWIYRAAL